MELVSSYHVRFTQVLFYLASAPNEPISLVRARQVAAVDELTAMLLAKALPAAERELEELTAFAQGKGFAESRLALWDVPFWSERLSEEKFGFEEEELRPYFALPNVLNGLFGCDLPLISPRPARPPRSSPSSISTISP